MGMAAALCAVAAVWMMSVPPAPVIRVRGLRPVSGEPPVTRMARRIAAYRPSRRRERTSARHAMVVELCDAVSAELQAGRAPEAALLHAVSTLGDEPAPVAAAIRAGEEPAAALEGLGRQPGAEGLRLLAACWRVGAERGGSLSRVIDGLATALRDEQSHRQEIAAQLSAPKATVKLLAALPLLGLSMGAVMGARPLTFLFTSVAGLSCLVTGVGLETLGLWWTHRIVTAAEVTR